jgi:glyoxylase-like metal-dependent hydrolase (beta-lactamase superfamily II)
MKALLLLMLTGFTSPAFGQSAGSMDVRWDEGAADCATVSQNPLQVHAYEPQTLVLRQSPCAHFEANFIYLLIGSDKALLIDTGAVPDVEKMPLAKTVLESLPHRDGSKIPLIVAHSHGHRDHHAGDPQFESLPSVQVVPVEQGAMQSFFGFKQWPHDVARLDLGGRTVYVIPAPGHHPSHLVFYDDKTGLLFSGDFLLPGRLLVDDATAYRESAMRIVDFLGNRPVTHILGGHIELDAEGRPYPHGSQHHPDERRLELAKEDLLALPAALDDFNGFYARHGNFILSNPVHNLLALAAAAVAILALLAWWLIRILRRRRRSGATQ